MIYSTDLNGQRNVKWCIINNTQSSGKIARILAFGKKMLIKSLNGNWRKEHKFVIV